MSQFTVNTVQLKKDYPFLDKIWTLYDEFNDTTDNLNDRKDDSVSMCEQIMQRVDDKQEWCIKLCIKLIRNLGTLSFENDKTKYNSERCKNLNSWLYYIIKEHAVDQDVITNIFDESNKLMGDENIRHQCSNYLYKDKYINPDHIIKLINLEDYMNDFLSILKDNNHENHCLCRKFIFECVNIYKKIHNEYCTYPYKEHKNRTDTCDKLRAFALAYNAFIFSNESIRSKIPSLDAAENEHILTCPSDGGNQETKAVKGHEQGSGVAPGQPSQDSIESAQQSGSTIPFNATTVVGTMAGIPPFLALLYKFTPVGTWLRSKYRNDADVFKNVDDEIEKELYYPRHENGVKNSSHERYNVAYEQI
ncbi:unnamed protein product [Plasmodium vivax]|uniref:(malaria parasite P. vivax) hypothetical protein n=1 Tax=Plasmodium vivax TaxID=5855 RepID=A0A8S4HAI8_PLAVI|nr:unnamed protein product [Plasmodium vivax]